MEKSEGYIILITALLPSHVKGNHKDHVGFPPLAQPEINLQATHNNPVAQTAIKLGQSFEKAQKEITLTESKTFYSKNSERLAGCNLTKLIYRV